MYIVTLIPLYITVPSYPKVQITLLSLDGAARVPAGRTKTVLLPVEYGGCPVYNLSINLQTSHQRRSLLLVSD